MMTAEDYRRADVERLYRAIADREPARELLQLVYDIFGDSCSLRPPADELRLAGVCKTPVRSHG